MVAAAAKICSTEFAAGYESSQSSRYGIGAAEVSQAAKSSMYS